MKTKSLPSQAELSKLLRYNPEAGRLFWRECADRSLSWNRQYAGKEAFTYVNSRGYKCGGINRTNYKAHRIIWRLVYGDEPEFIDHINGDTTDNRLVNLRAVSHSENMRNQKRHKTNTSGYNGVYWSRADRAWRAVIRVAGQSLYIGSYWSLEEAAEARRQFNVRFGYHPNHGRQCGG